MELQKPTSDEIDITQLFSRIGDFFKWIGSAIIRLLSLLRNVPVKNKALFLTLSLIGAMVGFGFSTFLKKKFYESSMILSSDYLNKRLVDNTIEKLNLLAEEVSPKGLAHVLHISDSLAENIDRFDARPFISESDLVETEVLKEQLKSAAQGESKSGKVIDQVIKRIEIENRHAFEITVRIYSPTVIKPLQDALVAYFKNNEYSKKRLEISQINLKAQKAKLLRESQKLDSLKRVIYSNYKTMAEQTRQGSNNVILSDKAVTNPIEIYNQDMTLYDQIQAVDRQLYLQPDFEVIDGFTEFNEPTSASMPKVIVIAALIGFAMGYVIVALRNFDNYLSTIS